MVGRLARRAVALAFDLDGLRALAPASLDSAVAAAVVEALAAEYAAEATLLEVDFRSAHTFVRAA